MAAIPQVRAYPYKGTPQTVKEMFSVAHGDRGSKSWALREVVEDVIRRVRPRDYWSEALAVYYWVCGPGFRYTRDPERVELLKDPSRLVYEIRTKGSAMGDCDDLATFLMAALSTIGTETRIVTVGFRPVNGEKPNPAVLSDPVFKLISSPHPRLPGPFTHVFAQAKKPYANTWVTLDPVAGPRIAEMHTRIKQARVYHAT